LIRFPVRRLDGRKPRNSVHIMLLIPCQDVRLWFAQSCSANPSKSHAISHVCILYIIFIQLCKSGVHV